MAEDGMINRVLPLISLFMFFLASIFARESFFTSPPPLAFLYHNDPQVRIKTIQELAQTNDPDIIDDLIRARSVEAYTPVHNAYQKALCSMTGETNLFSKTDWKTWLQKQVQSGKLSIDYRSFDIHEVELKERKYIQVLAFKLSPKYFDEMAQEALEADGDGLRYMVANDHLPQVREFLGGSWLHELFAQKLEPYQLNGVAYQLNGLANPSPIREKINQQIRTCLESENPTLVYNALHLLAGIKGFSTVFTVPDVEEKVIELSQSPDTDISEMANRTLVKIKAQSETKTETISYELAFKDLYETLGKEYPCFELKQIDWASVGKEMLPKVKEVQTDEQFGVLCMQLVARLEDSHAQLLPASAPLPEIPFPRWDPGFACLIDDKGNLVVYYVDKNSPAKKAAIRPGMTLVSINEEPAALAMGKCMNTLTKYVGYSSERYLRYQAARWCVRQMQKGTTVTLELQEITGEKRKFSLPATYGIRYLPRLPVPINEISDSKDVSRKMLPQNIGYIYVRRIKSGLISDLDRAVQALKESNGIIIDVRGNSGGGFDAKRAFRNFDLDDTQEPDRPRFKGSLALLIDARCISAGEGWASWFIAKKRAKVFGEATAGASSRKKVHTLKNGLFKLRYPVKAYRGFLDRPIERIGLIPDAALMPKAEDIANGRDTVLETAKNHLLEISQK